ncbi:hypothetical protein D9M73_180430 [compost metagenome]
MRHDPRIGQLVAGNFQLRLRPLQTALRRIALGRQDLHLLALRRQYRRGIGQPRGGLIDARLRLLRILHRAGTHPGEVLVAVQFMLGKRHFRLGRNHRGLRLGNHRRLTLEGRPGVLQLRPGHQRFGIGGLGGCAQIPVIDQRQQLPGLDLLVVLDQHFLDKPGDPRHDQGEIRRDVSIVGVLPGTLAEQAGHCQVQRPTDDQCDGHGHRDFLLCLGVHKNLLFQWSIQVGVRGG